jgi:Methyltransferase FkbM domain
LPKFVFVQSGIATLSHLPSAAGVGELHDHGLERIDLLKLDIEGAEERLLNAESESWFLRSTPRSSSPTARRRTPRSIASSSPYSSSGADH